MKVMCFGLGLKLFYCFFWGEFGYFVVIVVDCKGCGFMGVVFFMIVSYKCI